MLIRCYEVYLNPSLWLRCQNHAYQREIRSVRLEKLDLRYAFCAAQWVDMLPYCCNNKNFLHICDPDLKVWSKHNFLRTGEKNPNLITTCQPQDFCSSARIGNYELKAKCLLRCVICCVEWCASSGGSGCISILILFGHVNTSYILLERLFTCVLHDHLVRISGILQCAQSTRVETIVVRI
jgi:hypothetical protein